MSSSMYVVWCITSSPSTRVCECVCVGQLSPRIPFSLFFFGCSSIRWCVCVCVCVRLPLCGSLFVSPLWKPWFYWFSYPRPFHGLITSFSLFLENSAQRTCVCVLVWVRWNWRKTLFRTPTRRRHVLPGSPLSIPSRFVVLFLPLRGFLLCPLPPLCGISFLSLCVAQRASLMYARLRRSDGCAAARWSWSWLESARVMSQAFYAETTIKFLNFGSFVH